MEVITELLNECRVPTRSMIENLIHIELAFVNTSHPDFIGAGGLTKTIVDKLTAEKVAAKETEMRERALKDARAQIEQEKADIIIRSKNPQQPNAVPARPDKPAQPQVIPQIAPSRPAPASAIKHDKGLSGVFTSLMGPKKNKPKSKASLDNVPLVIKDEGPLTENEKFETDLIKTLMQSYFEIIRKNTQDITPKAIMYFLVNKSKEALHNRLVEHLYKEDLFDELLGESPDIVARRKTARELVAMLKRATEVMNEVRDFALK